MYKLNLDENSKEKSGFFKAAKALYYYIKGSRLNFIIAFGFLLVNSATVIYAPFLIGDITDKYIPIKDKDNLLSSLLFLSLIYGIGAFASYFQILIMGRVGQNILFRVRNAIFNKIQALPLQFFSENKAGDLISRINNDTEKLNQAFSETLLRFTGDIVVIAGIGSVMVYLNVTLGLIAVGTLIAMLIITFSLSGWIKARNAKSLQKLGEMSAEIQESLTNFKVTVVFNRRDYFKESFAKVNNENRKAATWAGIANGLLVPIYNYAGSIGSVLIIAFGIQILIFDKINAGTAPEFGALITFILYSNSFFNPLKEMAELFSQFQTSIASWSRISKILSLESNLNIIDSIETKHQDLLMKFDNVSFGYNLESMILKDINIDLDEGKTYALVGPTGGGKSTTANLMARLYDATEGRIFFKGKDIRSYEFETLSKHIGFILQEPFLFTGTLADNIKYGNEEIAKFNNKQLETKLKELGLEKLIEKFNEGLKTEVKPGSENISLGQKQLIAFVRVLLRQPKLLILDEATANIDTVTEELLQHILDQLPKQTTKVIIAHRLNTIENADQIFFISGGSIEKPLDFKSALDLINTSKRGS